MCASYRAAPGDPIDPDALTLHMARQLYRAARADADPYVSFVEARRLPSGWEVVVCDVEVEVGQRTIYDIRPHERVAALVPPDDDGIPRLVALREDFPAVPHLFPPAYGMPAQLCLYEQPPSEVRLGWTPTGYLQHIRSWLARTARGELHGDDQPLEPLLLAPAPPLIVPHDLAPTDGDVPEHLIVHARDGGNERIVYVAERPDNARLPAERVACVAVVIGGAPQSHGVIRSVPTTLGELHRFLHVADVDLRTRLARVLTTWGHDRQKLGLRLMLIVILPKTRHATSDVEDEDMWAFVSSQTIGEIGDALGLWQVRDGYAGFLLNPDTGRIGDDVPLGVLNPTRLLSRDRAAQLNGRPHRAATRMVAIGLGALGSQVFTNLARAGYGEWTLIDDDQVLPHNLARHALDGWALGAAKVTMLAASANKTIAGPPIATPVVANILTPGAQAETVAAALSATDVVIDMTAALAVARRLARDVDSAARRMSLFLNPAGDDLVLLAEDTGRQTPLDWAEMLYYRHILHEPMLLAHHHDDVTGRIRYGSGCRDVSSTLPQEQVALLAAIGSQGLRAALETADATVAIWHTDKVCGVDMTRAHPTRMIEHNRGEWTICTDAWIMERVAEVRARTLPVETGGVLVGSYDMRRRIVYVVDIVESPPDSVEWPTLYMRGCQGLHERLEDIEARTGGMLRYVGEWHTHPAGHGPEASDDDRAAFAWLGDWLGLDDCPPLMLIVGETAAWHGGDLA